MRLYDGLHTTAASGRVNRLAEGLAGLLGARLVRAYVSQGPARALTVCAEAFGPDADAAADGLGAAVPPDVTAGAYDDVILTDGPLPRLASVRAEPGRATVLVAWRPQAFRATEIELLKFLHAETAWVFDDAFARLGLPAGTEAVLELMLVGLPEKEIARKLDKSFHTVHSHVKRVYRHFSVSSRPELIARLYDRRAEEPRSEPAG